MTIYVDDPIWHWQGLKWCHLLADDADELHRFATRLGIKRASFQSAPKVTAPHYDLTGYERVRAMAMGAVPCDRHQIVAVLRRMRRCELVPPGDFLPAKASCSKNRIRPLLHSWRRS